MYTILYIYCLQVIESKQISIGGLIGLQQLNRVIRLVISDKIFSKVALRPAEPNTNDQRSRNGFCEGMIRRKATDLERLACNVPSPAKGTHFPKHLHRN